METIKSEQNVSTVATSSSTSGEAAKLSGTQITELRSRLGQSRADFARAMGVSLELVYDWQHGRVSPTAAQRSLLARLTQHADEYSDKVAMRPSLELALRDRKVDQIHSSEIVLNRAY